MESLPVEAIVAFQHFLGAVDLLACDCVMQVWKEVAGREGWKTACRRKVGTSSLALLIQPGSWKLSFFMFEFLRIVPGERAGGIRLGSPLDEFWSARDESEYWIRASQFFKLGPAACGFGRR